MILKKEEKKQIAEELLYYIASESNNDVEMDGEYEKGRYKNENKYLLYTSNINYLINFNTCYEGFIPDLVQNIARECDFIKDVVCEKIEKDAIHLIINGNKVKIYIDEAWLVCEFEGK